MTGKTAGRMRRGMGVMLGLFAALALASAFTSAAEAKTLNVVVLGDSYASGTGGGNYDIAGGVCLRGQTFWGAQYAAGLRQQGYTVNLTNNACAGATLDQIPGQLSALTKQTDLVLVMIGGNDIGFAGIVFSCYLPFFSSASSCRSAIDGAKAKVPDVQTKAIATINTALPLLRTGAKLAVVSYPYLTQDNKFLLGGYDSATGARTLGDLGDAQDKAVAASVNATAGRKVVEFVPTKDLFAGHETNADPNKDNPQKWLGESFGDLDSIYHPNPKGQTALAQAVLRFGDFGVSR